VQRLEGFAHGASVAHGDVDVVALEYATRHIRSIVVASAQAFERSILIAESGQERERELSRVEGLKGEIRYGFFDFYCIHGPSCLCDFSPLVSGCSSVTDVALRGFHCKWLPVRPRSVSRSGNRSGWTFISRPDSPMAGMAENLTAPFRVSA
jgi:hypothetical protein